MTLLLLFRSHGASSAPVVAYVQRSVSVPSLVSIARFKRSSK